MITANGHLDVQHSEARGSSRLFWRSWLPAGEMRAYIVLVHGLGEHSGRYEHVARHFTERGFGIYTLDHYGHGKSDGHPGFVQRFSVYADGIRALMAMAREQQPELPAYLLGHSMGGLIAASMLPRHQDEFVACILSGPALKTDAAPPAIVLLLNRILSAILPTLPMIQLDATAVSRDPAVVGAYVRDPLVFHGKLTSRLIAEMTSAMDNTLASAPAVTLPILLLHGEADTLTSPSGSVEYHANAGSGDKTLKLYPGLYHEIFNEPEKDEVLADASSWIEEHLP